MERGERGRRKEHDESKEQKEEDDESKEHKEEDERNRELDEFVKDWKRQQELDEFVDKWRREHGEEKEEKEESKESHTDQGEPEREVKNAVKELEEQEEERRQELERKEAEREESRKEREETADKDKYDEFEKWILDKLEERGADVDELRKRWQERFLEDMEKELEGEKDKENEEEEKSTGEGKTQEGHSAYHDGSGQMYEVKHEGKETSEGQQETEIEESEETQKPIPEQPRQEEKELPEHEGEKTEETAQKREAETQYSETEPQVEKAQESSKNLDKETKEQESPETSECTTKQEKQESKEKPEETKTETEEPEKEGEEERKSLWPGYFSEEEKQKEVSWSMFPEEKESKEQDWEEFVNSEWEKYSEEEKEEFRKLVWKRLEDEEDLERLLKRYELDHLLEDEELMEEISSYLDFRRQLNEAIENGTDEESAIETIADDLGIDPELASKWAKYEDLPEELHDLMARETQWRWSQKYRSFMEKVYPTSMDEFEDLSDTERRLVQAWLEIRELQEEDEIQFIVRKGKPFYNLDQVRELSLKYGVHEREILAWFKGQTLPYPVRNELLRKLSELNESQETPVKHVTSDEIGIDYNEILRHRIPSEKEVFALIERHPQVKEMKGFDVMKQLLIGYVQFKRMEMEGTLPYISQNELARQLGLSSSRISRYKHGHGTPKLLSILAAHESARTEQEKNLNPEVLHHRIAPELVYNKLSHLKDISGLSIRDIAASLREVFLNSNLSSKVRWMNLAPYAPVGQEWYRRIKKYCVDNRDDIEAELNRQLGLSKRPERRLRFGITGSKLYFRLHDTHENDWMYLYADEMFHFHEAKTKHDSLSRAKDRLGIKGEIALSRLVHQVTDYNRAETDRGMNTDLHYNASYIKGSTLGLVLQACNLRIQDIESNISFIGRIDRFGIRNPKFSDNPKEIDKAFARIFGAGLSDGHIDQFRVFCYCDTNRDRVEILKKHLSFFGEVDYAEKEVDGAIDVRFAAVLGRMLEKRGFCVGDKAVQNSGLPEFILSGDIDTVIEYLKQLWAEDGHFLFGKDVRAHFGWTRAVSLTDPEKTKKYKLSSLFSSSLIEFIKTHGNYIDGNSFDKEGSYYPRFIIHGSSISKLVDSEDNTISELASLLSTVIEENKPKLLIGEQQLIKRIGAKSKSVCSEVIYYLDSGRVSALWRAKTRKLDDAMRVAVLAPPDDIVKKKKVQTWIQSQPERHARILGEITGSNLKMSPEDY